eukprot:5100248-Prymnesium_polylepis.1
MGAFGAPQSAANTTTSSSSSTSTASGPSRYSPTPAASGTELDIGHELRAPASSDDDIVSLGSGAGDATIETTDME